MENEIKRNSAGLPVRRLGRSEEEVSIIGLGGGHLARSVVPRDFAVKIVQTAADEGITFFDTAWEYWQGESEIRMGLGLEGRRDGVFLMTKVCARDREGAEKQLHESLTRLRTDRIDLWQFHEINYDNDPDWIFAAGGALEAALKARETGKIRFIGFTGHKSPHIFRKMLAQDFNWDSCQMPITIMDAHYRSFQREILPELNRRGIAALGMKSLGGDAQNGEERRADASAVPPLCLVAADHDADYGSAVSRESAAGRGDRAHLHAHERRGKGEPSRKGPPRG